ncbi:hypothetical protein LX32DRAFT_76215 [Colletotrichum zoysiae]|uniref:Uncharacterized protein n=1 Tax=Colletotrichum zoysiae TaxID=1216348 RepID=A0AAD9LXQ9_9PEZI|nr:hypothetical protein LX32DRAFT_76215 [Colletotrichum zoysiae]
MADVERYVSEIIGLSQPHSRPHVCSSPCHSASNTYDTVHPTFVFVRQRSPEHRLFVHWLVGHVGGFGLGALTMSHIPKRNSVD